MGEELWIYLAASPLLWLTATLAVWIAAIGLSKLYLGNPLLNPTLVSVSAIALVLLIAKVDYRRYFDGAQFIHFLLGPATVALGIPLYERLSLVKANLFPVSVALLVGSTTAVGSTAYLCRALGLADQVTASLAPKSTTAAVAMAVSSGLGGNPALTAAVVVLTGICGAVIVTPLMNVMRVKDFAARGFAVGLASHGIGTARAYSVNPVAGLFAGIAMGLNAILTSMIVHAFL
ncbi:MULTISPECIES: LrgB family protein [unclassified Mesorhizobium]|uniref:LrgB family protein n=1 Tax=unclassified Mesorhizobium TaxID=325217 RepID=UPI000FE7ACC0|nr:MULTISPECIES: LrgB family protein [unclassified Mesorhizobium]RWB98653.1 MAG: LrgB family protein [Mesorhizobium sp.]TGV21909.1 LrgB family protein [Mesorhizobium sp. M4B.F.Ca.ET.143.01.1.1]